MMLLHFYKEIHRSERCDMNQFTSCWPAVGDAAVDVQLSTRVNCAMKHHIISFKPPASACLILERDAHVICLRTLNLCIVSSNIKSHTLILSVGLTRPTAGFLGAVRNNVECEGSCHENFNRVHKFRVLLSALVSLSWTVLYRAAKTRARALLRAWAIRSASSFRSSALLRASSWTSGAKGSSWMKPRARLSSSISTFKVSQRSVVSSNLCPRASQSGTCR